MASINVAISHRSDVPSGPSSWELFLLGEGIPEGSCSSILAGRSRKGRAIRSWVRDHYSTKFVPESVLDALGLRKQLRFRWLKED